ncbi:MAG: mannose-1-phosphate guanylyltransferase [Planctomycetota bacterium]|jgi:mannose-1-phosphate guanylyltransferase|nr:mannose-1-phosphate guanylyltransferase [Planctomycetota bacterium]
MANTIFAVIMAGGAGTRFWPASRENLPKQFLRVEDGHSLLRGTWSRLDGLVDPENILVVCGQGHADLVRAELPELSEKHLILEPVGRNTLPCLALAQKFLREIDPDAIQIVLPADHIIPSRDAFQQSVGAAIHAAQSGGLVTLGIQATFPATGYGYIQPGDPIEDVSGGKAWAVRRFIEKPDMARAQELLASGEFFWNSGIFVWATSAFESALERHAPELWHGLLDCAEGGLEEFMEGVSPLSIDVGVLEKEEDCKVVGAEFHWSDVGSWPALDDVLPDAGAGNRCSGEGQLIAVNASNNVVHGPDGHLTALIGVEDLVVVHTEGASLVCSKEHAQDVRAVVKQVREQAPDRA